MALVDETATKRIEVYDGWVDIKANLSIGAVLGMAEGRGLATLYERTPETVRAMLNGGIVAWSYDEPVTPENIARLEISVAAKVQTAIDELFRGPEKKESSNGKRSSAAAGTRASSTSS